MKFVNCRVCPLRALPLFTDHTDAEVASIESMKRDQVVVCAERSILHEGQSAAPLYALLSGWAYRFKTLATAGARSSTFCWQGTS